METATKVQEVPKDNVLTSLIKSSNLDKAKSDAILASFSDIIELTDEWKKKADSLIITDPSQTDLIEEARNGRHFLRDKRLALVKKHQELKEVSLREGQALDAIKRTLLGLIEPIEENLKLKEDFAKIWEENRIAKLKEERLSKLAEFDIHQEVGYDLGGMPEEVWEAFLSGTKSNWELKREQVRKKEEAQNIYNERKEFIRFNYGDVYTPELPGFWPLTTETTTEEYKNLLGILKSAIDAHDEKVRIDNLHISRKESVLNLWPFVPEFAKTENFGAMDEKTWEAFKGALVIEKDQFDKKQEETLLENERLQKEADQKKEDDRVRDEIQSKRLNELLPYNGFGADVDMTTLHSLSVPVYSGILQKKKAAFDADKKLKDEQATKAKEAQDALDLKNKQEQDEKTSKEEEDRLASLASEKDKFLRFASLVQVMVIPQMDTPTGKQVMKDVEVKRDSFVKWIAEQASRL